MAKSLCKDQSIFSEFLKGGGQVCSPAVPLSSILARGGTFIRRHTQGGTHKEVETRRNKQGGTQKEVHTRS